MKDLTDPVISFVTYLRILGGREENELISKVP